MPRNGLTSFIRQLEASGDLRRIKPFVNPELEITEITDRIVKNEGKALLFENTGTAFPILINAFGSESRMASAIGRKNLEEAGEELLELFSMLTGPSRSVLMGLKSLTRLLRIASFMPSRSRRKGACQEVVHHDPDLSVMPVLKCWPFDGGRFITLPMVHTINPLTGSTNVGMYRMQITGKNTAGMHWQRHKTGAAHYEAWKKKGGRMPVSVSLGGDPVYTYAATAPLPENISEYILAGFLRKRKVRLVKCLTNELFVPEDADIVIEGYVDTGEDMIWEGPFGDHTGFYSLADWYPRFHVTCISHRKDAIYPATIVGVPPQEDSWFARATERLFLAPVRMALLPEVIDFHMPDAGVAHNLVIVKISKTYPGQGMKVLSSLFGAGQMMFSKYIIVVSGDVDIRDYGKLFRHISVNTSVKSDLVFGKGPLDVLDHASDTFSFGGKLGIDATVKLPEEGGARQADQEVTGQDNEYMKLLSSLHSVKAVSIVPGESSFKLAVIAVDPLSPGWKDEMTGLFKAHNQLKQIRMLIAVGHPADPADYFTVAWQLLGNSDPARDHSFLAGESILIDGTIKAYRQGGFPRRWPNVVCSSEDTIRAVDEKWESLELGGFIESPSLKTRKLLHGGNEEVVI